MSSCSPIRSASLAATASILIATVPAQAWRRFTEDLGDPNKGEAAELELLAMGSKAIPALEEVLDGPDLKAPREVERFLAALRVIDLLGHAADPVRATLPPFITSGDGMRLRKRDPRIMIALLRAIGTLCPYGSELQFHELFHHSIISADQREKEAAMRGILRFKCREETRIETVEEARNLLDGDKVFVRAVAADYLGRHGTQEDAEKLRARLLARDRKPDGWDSVTYNGVVQPIEDDFAFCAARAIVRLAPDDPVSVVGHAVLALHHPHHTRRLAAMRSLARFGPDAAAVVPELMQAATGDDHELAAEALKILGMAGDAVGKHLAAIDTLSRSPDETVARFAGSLARRLRAMGHTVPEPDLAEVAAAARKKALRAAVGAIGDGAGQPTAATRAVLEEAPAEAIEYLLARLQDEADDTPDGVVRALGDLGAGLPEDERTPLWHAVATTGVQWSGPSFSSSSGGRALSRARKLAYGRLQLGRPATAAELVEGLEHDNAFVRLAAAHHAATAGSAFVAGDDATVRDALWKAVSAEHPHSSKFSTGRRSTQELKDDLDDEIRTAAAAALLAAPQPKERHATLLRCALAHEDDAVVVRAIEAWRTGADAGDLEKAAKDPREKVAGAARAALESRDR